MTAPATGQALARLASPLRTRSVLGWGAPTVVPPRWRCPRITPSETTSATSAPVMPPAIAARMIALSKIFIGRG